MSSYLLFCIAQIPSAVSRGTNPHRSARLLMNIRPSTLFSRPRDTASSPLSAIRLSRTSTCNAQSLQFRRLRPDSQDVPATRSRAFIADRLPAIPPRSNLEPCQYAMLDEHSARDKTVVIAHSYSSLSMRDPDDMTESELEEWTRACDELDDETDDSWREWRVSFDDAERLITVLSFESDFTPKLYNDEFVAAHTDDKGVFRYQPAFEDFAERAVQT